MKKHLLLGVGALALFCSHAALAQMPAAAPVAGAPGGQPAAAGDKPMTGLPQVRSCTQKDIIGIWKLISIAEDPVGPTTENFYREPQQYIWFQDNSLFGEESGIQVYSEASSLMQVMRRKENQALLQYVVTEKGVIYTYKNRIATDGLNCAYVTYYQEPYKEGDIILFASEKNPTRLMKLYRQTLRSAPSDPAAQPPANPAAPAVDPAAATQPQAAAPVLAPNSPVVQQIQADSATAAPASAPQQAVPPAAAPATAATPVPPAAAPAPAPAAAVPPATPPAATTPPATQ